MKVNVAKVAFIRSNDNRRLHETGTFPDQNHSQRQTVISFHVLDTFVWSIKHAYLHANTVDSVAYRPFKWFKHRDSWWFQFFELASASASEVVWNLSNKSIHVIRNLNVSIINSVKWLNHNWISIEHDLPPDYITPRQLRWGKVMEMDAAQEALSWLTTKRFV